MSPAVRSARNGEVSIAYETFRDPAAEPLLLIMGLDFQMVWWPDAFCRLLAGRGFAVARFDNRDTGCRPLHLAGPVEPVPGARGAHRPAYTAFPEEWARAAATTSHDRSPRDPTSTQRQVAAGRAERLPSLSRIAAPTLVIAGEDDPLVRVRAARETARRIPGALLAAYPGMGHNLPEELWPDVVERVTALAR